MNIPEWSLSDQGVTALTGPSGSGKSTILKILCGLTPCPGLFWEFQNKNLALLSPPERQIGMCFQDLRLFPHWTAKKNILFAVKARGIPVKERQKDFEEIVCCLELKDKLNLSIEKLSGGEQKRVALARALIVKPKWLFLDEPFSYLDEKAKQKARRLSLNAIKKHSIPLLLVSHDRTDIKDLATEEFFLKNGQIYKR